MKKALLFSLLLSSTFTYLNAAEPTTAAVEQAAASNEAPINKEEILGGRPEKKYKAIGLDGKEIEVQFFDKSAHPGLVTKKLKMQDGGTYDPKGKQNFPYMAGEKMPEGAAVVYVLRKADNPDEFKLASADADIGKFPGYTANDPKEYWMYKDENNYLYPYVEEEDPNASLILGKKASVYVYEVPDFETTAQQKKIIELEEKIKSGGFGAAPGAAAPSTPVANSAGSPFSEKFQFGEELVGGKHVDLVLTTSDPKATEKNFAEFKEDFLKLCSAHPNVAVAIFSLALEDESVLAEGKVENLKTIRLFDKGIAATLMFSSEVTPAQARAFVESLKLTSTMSPDDIKNLQEEHARKAAEYELAMKALEEEKRKTEEALEEARIAEELAAKILDEKTRAEIEAQKAAQEVQIATEVVQKTEEELQQERMKAAKTEEELQQTQIEAAKVEKELHQTQAEAIKTEQELTEEKAKLAEEIKEKKSEIEEKKDELAEAHENLHEAHANLNELHATIGETSAALLDATTKQSTTEQQQVAVTEPALVAEQHQDATHIVAAENQQPVEAQQPVVAEPIDAQQHELHQGEPVVAVPVANEEQHQDATHIVAAENQQHSDVPVQATAVNPSEQQPPVVSAAVVDKSQETSKAAVGEIPVATVVEPEKPAVAQPINLGQSEKPAAGPLEFLNKHLGLGSEQQQPAAAEPIASN